jgi:hypothetical protein
MPLGKPPAAVSSRRCQRAGKKPRIPRSVRPERDFGQSALSGNNGWQKFQLHRLLYVICRTIHFPDAWFIL